MKSSPSLFLIAAMLACLAACSPRQHATTAQVLVVDLTQHEKPKELGDGWSGPEGLYTWTDGHAAELDLGKAPASGAVISIYAAGFGQPGSSQPVDVVANGSKIANWQVGVDSPASYDAQIPGDLIQRSPTLKVEFLLPNAAQPVPGGRLLGLSVRRITLTPKAAAPSSAPSIAKP